MKIPFDITKRPQIEHIAAETAIREGWTSEIIHPTYPRYTNLCPKCKEK